MPKHPKRPEYTHNQESAPQPAELTKSLDGSPAPPPRKADPTGFAGWMKRHGRWVSYAGTMLVFMTFVAREGFSEHWAHIAEAIDTARYFYLIRVDTSEEKMRFDELNAKIADLSSRVKTAQQTPAAVHIADSSVIRGKGNDKMLSTIEIVLSNIKLLSQTISIDDAGVEKKLSEFSNEVSQAKQERTGVEEEKRAKKISVENKRDEPVASTTTTNGSQWSQGVPGRKLASSPRFLFGTIARTQFYSLSKTTKWSYKSQNLDLFISHFWTTNYPGEGREIDLEQSLTGLQIDVNKFNGEVLEEADVVKTNNERRSKKAWRWSAFTFTLGLILGILGKAYDLPEAAGAGEG